MQNSNETEDLMGNAAQASSIGSTDKRSQVSSDYMRKRDHMAITEPTLQDCDETKGHSSGPIDTFMDVSGGDQSQH